MECWRHGQICRKRTNAKIEKEEVEKRAYDLPEAERCKHMAHKAARSKLRLFHHLLLAPN